MKIPLMLTHCILLAIILIFGCMPSLPGVVQNHIVPQAFEWQHTDITDAEFTATETVESHQGRSTEALFDAVKVKLEQLEYRPKNYSGIKSTLVGAVPENDLTRKARDQSQKTAGRWGRYEKYPHFKPVQVPVEADIQLTGVLAVHDEVHPYVIIVPGTFDSRDAIYIRDTALLCYRYGYNVLILETRNHGQSIGLWTSIGWKEGRDILASAKWLKQAQYSATRSIGIAKSDGFGGDLAIPAEPVDDFISWKSLKQNPNEKTEHSPSVAVIGFSLGAWYTIRAAYDASVTSQEHLLNGGVIAFNPPVNVKKAVLDWNRDDYRGSELTLRSQMFKQFDSYLKTRIKELGKAAEFKAAGETFDAYASLAADAHGLSREELYQRAALSPKQLAENVRVPVVAYHAEDDPVVSVQHSQALKQAVATNDTGYIKVIIEEKGGHIGLQEAAPDYYVNLILTVLEGLKR